MTSVIVKDLYPLVAKALDKNSSKFRDNIAKFMNDRLKELGAQIVLVALLARVELYRHPARQVFFERFVHFNDAFGRYLSCEKHFCFVHGDLRYLIKFVLTGGSFSGSPYFSLPSAMLFIRKVIFRASVLIV